MICSYRHNFLFIKTRKTASTSVEIGLSSLCGEDDIITPISPNDEILRRDHGELPRNFSASPLLEKIYRSATATRTRKVVNLARRRLVSHAEFFNHMSAELVQARLPSGDWERLQKFTIERHPYEKVVSMANFWKSTRKNLRGAPLESIIEQIIASKRFLNYPLYTIGGQLAVDHILRYENLLEDLNNLLSKLNAPNLPNLPRAKGKFRPDRAPAAEVLSESQKRQIAELAQFEFDLMGYEE